MNHVGQCTIVNINCFRDLRSVQFDKMDYVIASVENMKEAIKVS